MPSLICVEKMSPDTTSSPIHFKKSTRSTTYPTAHYESTPIPDFLDLASNYYQSHQAQCFKNDPASTPIMTIIHKVARRIEIIWYNNHPFTPHPSFLHCMQTILESEQSMIPILTVSRIIIKADTLVTQLFLLLYSLYLI